VTFGVSISINIIEGIGEVMAEYETRRPLMVPPPHPGSLMREILAEHLGLPIATAARRMGTSRGALYGVLDAKASLTPDMALRFGKLTGTPVEVLLRMQTAHELWHAERRLTGALKKIETAKRAA
jgi:addiction module HigA family antidote